MCEELKKDLTDLAKKAMEIQDKYKGIGRVGLTTLSDCVIVSNAGSREKDFDIHFCFEFNELKNVPTGIDTETNNLQQQDTTKERDFASVKLEKIAELIELQVQNNLKRPDVHSLHEAYGLILEEYQETESELDSCNLRINKYWEYVKADQPTKALEYLDKLAISSLSLIEESFDLASVVFKAINQLKGDK